MGSLSSFSHCNYEKVWNPLHIRNVGSELSERIQSCKEDLKGQTVAVVGLGISGRAAVRLALARGAAVLAIDRNEKLVPLEHDSMFANHAKLRTVLGHVDRKLLEDADRVVVSPGVPLENYGLSALLQSRTIVMSELDFAAEVIPSKIKVLAVTGTNGKSTVTTFAGQMLHRLGIKAFIGGNLGNPLSDAAVQCLESSSAEDSFQVAVVEVSSYQLEIPNKYFCPSVAVVLNLTPDHLERHKTMRNYALTKCQLFSRMSDSKLALLPTGNKHLKEVYGHCMDNCNVAWIGDLPGVKMTGEAKVANLSIPTTGLITQLQFGTLKAPGTHNYLNAAVAAFSVIGLDVGIDADSIEATIEALRPPPHRMQIIFRDTYGITWVDDSKATNVEATYAGLMGLKAHKSVVLLGGLAKGRCLSDSLALAFGKVDGVDSNIENSNGFEKLVEPLKYHRCVITFVLSPSWLSVKANKTLDEFAKFGYSGKMIQRTLYDAGLTIPCIRVAKLEDAVSSARSIAKSGDAIVLSPGCASFDEFRNFVHRGKVFQELAFLTH